MSLLYELATLQFYFYSPQFVQSQDFLTTVFHQINLDNCISPFVLLQ